MGADSGDLTGQWVARLDGSDPAVRFVRVAGKLDQRGAPELRRLIDDQLAASPQRFLLDLTELSALDSGGARSLVAATEYAAELKVDLRVVASNGVAGALRAAAAPHRLPLHGSLDEALEPLAE